MHRNLKPSNFLFTNSQSKNVKIVDFSLAQFYNKKNKFIYVNAGTPGYVAPEILENLEEKQRYDCKCDMFSLGILFYEM